MDRIFPHAHLAMILVAGLLLVPQVQAQTVVEMYREARYKAQVERIFQEHGRRARPMQPEHVPSRADTVTIWLAELRGEKVEEETEPSFEVSSWRLIRKLERGWFKKQHQETLWAYVGSNWITPLDTMYTRELRARMEARFGAPTVTLTELDASQNLGRDEYIQFEYWFVLNDSVPLIVMDVNGPYDRGLVVASDQRYRETLHDIKYAFLQEVTRSSELAPYVDYYYNVLEQAWYRTGYDGSAFFMRRITRPNVTRGRPLLADPNG